MGAEVVEDKKLIEDEAVRRARWVPRTCEGGRGAGAMHEALLEALGGRGQWRLAEGLAVGWDVEQELCGRVEVEQEPGGTVEPGPAEVPNQSPPTRAASVLPPMIDLPAPWGMWQEVESEQEVRREPSSHPSPVGPDRSFSHYEPGDPGPHQGCH